MSGTVRFETARGCMRLLASQSFLEMFEIFGISPEELTETMGAKPWHGSARERVRRVLDAVCHGVMDVVAVPRFEMPAEYIAAVIVGFVHPTNMMLACRFMERSRPVVSLISGERETDVISAKQLFGLCCMMVDDKDAAAIRSQFEKRLGKALNEAIGGDQDGKDRKA